MKKTIPFLIFFLLVLNILGQEVKTKNFDESIQEIKNAHIKVRDSMLDEKIQDRTKPILFNLGMSLIYKEIEIMDAQDERTHGFKDEHNRIIGNVQDINGYLDTYFPEVISMIDSYKNETSRTTSSTNHNKKKIGKLYWQIGKASAWEDCPIQPGYSEIHGETLCVTDGETAEDYCKKMNGRLPTVKEFWLAFKKDESISKDSRWPKYWTSDKKKGLHLSITLSSYLAETVKNYKPQLQSDSAASIRCVWDK
ncbi:MAG: hypothetical protein JJT78_04575 [Leptospira sp.]|nr:hypothetical protein [Leptospira sp.]